MLQAELRSKIDKLWDLFWSGGIANPLTAIEQISYLIFMKRLDEADLKRKEDAKWLKTSYNIPLYSKNMKTVAGIIGNI